MNQALNDEFTAKREGLEALCRKYGVAELYLFGSATASGFRPDKSDLDFLVTFRTEPEASLADRYLGLAEELETLFDRPVDLITERAIRNPYFRHSVETSRVSVYAA